MSAQKLIKELDDRLIDLPVEQQNLQAEINRIHVKVAAHNVAYALIEEPTAAQTSQKEELDAKVLLLDEVSEFTISGVTASGDAVAANVLSGKVFSAENLNNVAGVMPNRAALSFVPSASNQSIPAGYYNGNGVVSGDADLIAANIASGVVLFGVTGTH